MDLSVVVVTHRSRAHVGDCLRSLDRARGALVMEVLVVDNASDDGTGDALRDAAPEARLLPMGGNLGYARAVNAGIRASSGALVLVLNPDCVVEPDALAALVAWMRAHPGCGVAGAALRHPDGSTEFSARAFPSAAAFLFNRYSLATRLWPGNPWSRRYLISDWDRTTPRSVDWVSGACMMVRREAITRVGGMDEAYFLFNEDVDWCHAMKDAGWTVDFVPSAIVMHHVGASRSKVTDHVILERHRGMIHYYRKYHRPHPAAAALVGAAVMLRARWMLALNAWRR